MKPHRIRMCHNLLLNYRVYEKMDVFVRHLFPFRFVKFLSNLYLVRLIYIHINI